MRQKIFLTILVLGTYAAVSYSQKSVTTILFEYHNYTNNKNVISLHPVIKNKRIKHFVEIDPIETIQKFDSIVIAKEEVVSVETFLSFRVINSLNSGLDSDSIYRFPLPYSNPIEQSENADQLFDKWMAEIVFLSDTRLKKSKKYLSLKAFDENSCNDPNLRKRVGISISDIQYGYHWFLYDGSQKVIDTIYFPIEHYHSSYLDELVGYQDWLSKQKDGKQTYLYADSKVIAYFKKGKLEGTYTVFDDDEKIVLSGMFKNGKPQGHWFLWNKSLDNYYSWLVEEFKIFPKSYKMIRSEDYIERLP